MMHVLAGRYCEVSLGGERKGKGLQLLSELKQWWSPISCKYCATSVL